MRRLVWALVALAVLCGGLLGVAQSMPKIGTQSVLLILPKDFHDEEFIYVLQQFVDREADIYVTSVDTTTTSEVAALTARIPERFFNLQPGTSGGPRVSVIPSMMSFEFIYDKAITLGAGWYDEYFAPSGYTGPTDPSYSDGLYWFINRQLSDHGVFGAIGAGLYPLIFSGVLPLDTMVPAYPCPDLISVIAGAGYQPVQMGETPRTDGRDWPPLVVVDTYVADVDSSKAVMTPIPNSWYPLDDGLGPLLVTDYETVLGDSISTIEECYSNLHP
jgi:hypothetical protein